MHKHTDWQLIQQPHRWPMPWRWISLTVLGLVSALVWWWGWLVNGQQAWSDALGIEQQLRQDWAQAVAQRTAYARQRQHLRQLEQEVATLQSWGQVDGDLVELLEQVQRLAREQGVRLDAWRPLPAESRPYWQEAPVSIRLSGHYAAIGRWLSTVAQDIRALAFDPVTLTLGDRPGQVTLEAVMRVFRHPDHPTQVVIPTGAQP